MLKDYAKQEFLTKELRDEYDIEAAKNEILNNLHVLEGRVGAAATRAWLLANFVELPF